MKKLMNLCVLDKSADIVISFVRDGPVIHPVVLV